MSPDKHYNKLSSTNYVTWPVRMQYHIIKQCYVAIEFEVDDDGNFTIVLMPAANNLKIVLQKQVGSVACQVQLR